LRLEYVYGVVDATERRLRTRALPHIRTSIALVAALLLGQAWAADPAPSSGIESCGSITDDKERLGCFDRELALLKKDRKPTVVVHGTPPATELTPEQAIGLTPGKILQLQGGQSATKLNELTVKIQSISSNGSGHAVYILDNGQVWQQVETDPKFSVRPGDTVTLTRGALDSFFMSANAHMTTRVRRAK
jgi:hypothetical protein